MLVSSNRRVAKATFILIIIKKVYKNCISTCAVVILRLLILQSCVKNGSSLIIINFYKKSPKLWVFSSSTLRFLLQLSLSSLYCQFLMAYYVRVCFISVYFIIQIYIYIYFLVEQTTIPRKFFFCVSVQFEIYYESRLRYIMNLGFTSR